MGERSKIAWTDHTFNPWWGCARVSPGCENCYAETFAKRIGHGKRLPQIWGVQGERKLFGEKHWREPLRWNAAAEKAGERHRVFCASMADVFEERPELVAPRAKLWRLIGETPSLDWLLLTKRPENAEFLASQAALLAWDGGGPDAPVWPPNVWLGVTCEDQKRADERLSTLLTIAGPAVRFASYEPALEEVDFFAFLRSNIRDASLAALGSPPLPGLDWIIVGGESGPDARTFDVAWARNVLAQVLGTTASVFIKQLGARASDPVNGLAGASLAVPHDARALVAQRLRDRAGADPSEWPDYLRVREVPEVRRAG